MSQLLFSLLSDGIEQIRNESIENISEIDGKTKDGQAQNIQEKGSFLISRQGQGFGAGSVALGLSQCHSEKLVQFFKN